MDQKKYHLQKQIIEAVKANDNDLYSLLKSQWAHRFGVESLEELENIDLDQLNQNINNFDSKITDQSQEKSIEGDKPIRKKDDPQGKEINTKKFDSTKNVDIESFKIKSYKLGDKKDNKSQSINQFCDNKNKDEIKALIPLPPKPRYGFLSKWLVRK